MVVHKLRSNVHDNHSLRTLAEGLIARVSNASSSAPPAYPPTLGMVRRAVAIWQDAIIADAAKNLRANVMTPAVSIAHFFKPLYCRSTKREVERFAAWYGFSACCGLYSTWSNLAMRSVWSLVPVCDHLLFISLLLFITTVPLLLYSSTKSGFFLEEKWEVFFFNYFIMAFLRKMWWWSPVIHYSCCSCCTL